MPIMSSIAVASKPPWTCGTTKSCRIGPALAKPANLSDRRAQRRAAVVAEAARRDRLVALGADHLRGAFRLLRRGRFQLHPAGRAETRLLMVEHAAARAIDAVRRRGGGGRRAHLGAVAVDGAPDILDRKSVV